jgi:plasmid stabilization system protein ParE
MVEKVIWLEEALLAFEKVKENLLVSFGEKAVAHCIRSIERKITSIRSNPKLYPSTNRRKNIRKAVLHKRLVLFYKYKPRLKEIHILSLWDTRRQHK